MIIEDEYLLCCYVELLAGLNIYFLKRSKTHSIYKLKKGKDQIENLHNGHIELEVEVRIYPVKSLRIHYLDISSRKVGIYFKIT